MRLKANKTSLYNLVATYKPLPGMRRVDFQKANGRPDYWLEWTTDDGHTKAFLSSTMPRSRRLSTERRCASWYSCPPAASCVVIVRIGCPMEEEVTTAMERRRQAHGRA